MDELSIEQLEKRLEGARVQRLMLRIQYQQAANIKLASLGRKSRDKLRHQLEMFAKELSTLDKCIEKCSSRMEQVNITKNEISYIDDAIEEEEVI